MRENFSERNWQILILARAEARRLNHDFVGTEHILLALLAEDIGIGARAMKKLGITAENVRAEIEKRVGRGQVVPSQGELPLTPRARQAIELAAEEANTFEQRYIEPGHLLLGLMREPEGVAGMVLRSFDIGWRQAIEAVLENRLLQLKTVERIVRPVRTAAPRKRKMREELLAHLEAIYEEELSGGNDPAAAIKVAGRRIGDPAELSRQLQAALPWTHYVDYFGERLFGWRAPESVLRFQLRVASHLLMIVVALWLFVELAAMARWGIAIAWRAFTPATTMVVLLPIAQITVGTLYFKLRDSIWGAFGTAKSWKRASWFALLIAISTAVIGIGFIATSRGFYVLEIWTVLAVCAAGVVAAGILIWHALYYGGVEIADTNWALLDLSDSTPSLE